jgi:hypothetical protein
MCLKNSVCSEVTSEVHLTRLIGLIFFIGKMRVKFLNFINVYKDPPSEFRTHDLPHKRLIELIN